MTIQQEQPWQETARKVQADRDRSIAQVKPPIPLLPSQLPSRVIDIPRQHLSSEELAITESSAKDLVSALSTGNLTATATVKAFLRRAALAQKLVSSRLADKLFPVLFSSAESNIDKLHI